MIFSHIYADNTKDRKTWNNWNSVNSALFPFPEPTAVIVSCWVASKKPVASFHLLCEYPQTICRFGMYRLWDQILHFGWSNSSVSPQLFVDSACILGSPIFARFSSWNFSQKFRATFSRRFSGCRVNIFPSVFRVLNPEKTCLSSWGTL